MIQAIPTSYAGHKFRSRLEARWALFFDLIGVPWEYEREAFALTIEGRPAGFTPDFWLPKQGIWFEVKAEEDAYDSQAKQELILKFWAFVDNSDLLYVALGTPRDAWIWRIDAKEHGADHVRPTWARCDVCLSWDLGVEGQEMRMCGHVAERIGHGMAEGALDDASAYRFWNPKPKANAKESNYERGGKFEWDDGGYIRD